VGGAYEDPMAVATSIKYSVSLNRQFTLYWPRSHPHEPIAVKFCVTKRNYVPLGSSKFHMNRCSESPLRGENADIWLVNKNNTGSLPLRVILPVTPHTILFCHFLRYMLRSGNSTSTIDHILSNISSARRYLRDVCSSWVAALKRRSASTEIR